MSACPCFARIAARLRQAAGAPGSGAHALRLGPFALVDVALTVVVGWALFRWLAARHPSLRGNLACFLVGLLAATVPVHLLFGVETAAVRMLRAWGALPPRQ